MSMISRVLPVFKSEGGLMLKPHPTWKVVSLSTYRGLDF